MYSEISKSGTNKGSCTKLTTYLEKENDQKVETEREQFFSVNRDKCNKWEVIQQIDQNAKSQGLQTKEDKFYSIIVSPSQQELAHIGNDSAKLKEYTRGVMENYAANFNKGIESKDLMWYAKVEYERKHPFDSPEVKDGKAQTGELKEGDQRHIHIIVSRCAARENNHVIQVEQPNKNLERTMKLSPQTNHRGEGLGAVKSGFDRNAFFKANEQTFDQQFKYDRPLEQRYHYCNALKNGNSQDYQTAVNSVATNTQEQSRSINKAAGLSTDL